MNSVRKTAGQPAATEQDDPRWAAIVSRDAGADGMFFFCVRTTGVYCRPSCPARTPKRENVEFHATREAAASAGFRPCKRCKPDQPPLAQRRAATIAAACRRIEEAERVPNLDSLAREAGMSPYHFHRTFKSVTGLTPRAYAAAKRAARVRDTMLRDGSVTSAIYDAGFNSGGRFYDGADRVLGMTPTAFRAGGASTDIRFAIGECSLGSILVAASPRGICAIALGDDPETLARELQDRFPRANLIGGDPQFERWIATVVGFVEAPAVGSRFAARRSRHRVSAARVASPHEDPARLDGDLHRDGRTDRSADVAACGRPRVRRQSDRACDPLSSRRAQRRRDCRATAGASNASARSSRAKRADERVGRNRRGAPRERSRRPRGRARLGRAHGELEARGHAHVQGLLTGDECRQVAELYDDERHFRKRVVMARHGFGRGEYQYFAYPLPAIGRQSFARRSIRALRLSRIAGASSCERRRDIPTRMRSSSHAVTRRAGSAHAAAASLWRRRLQLPASGPVRRARVSAAGDVAVVAAGPRFPGGEFVLTEQRPRMQSRAEVVPLARGDAVIFAVRHRPVRGARGFYRVNLRHGISRVASGRRRTLGIIFHDAV